MIDELSVEDYSGLTAKLKDCLKLCCWQWCVHDGGGDDGVDDGVDDGDDVDVDVDVDVDDDDGVGNEVLMVTFSSGLDATNSPSDTCAKKDSNQFFFPFLCH